MAGTCNRCSAPVRAAAQYCRRCGDRVATAKRTAARALPAAASPPIEQVLYRGNGLTVTTAFVTIGETTMAASAVASVALKEYRRNAFFAAGGVIVGVVLGSIGISLLRDIGSSGIFGFVMLLLGVGIAAKTCLDAAVGRRSYGIILKTTGGQTHTVTGADRRDLERATDAVARAMGKR